MALAAIEEEPFGGVFILGDWFGDEGVLVLGSEVIFEGADGLDVLLGGTGLGVWVEAYFGEDLGGEGGDFGGDS